MPCVRPDPVATAALSESGGALRSEFRVPSPSLQSWARAMSRCIQVLVMALGLLPGWAWACPTCVARAPESEGRSALLVGALLLAPFLLVAVGVWAAVRVARGDAKRST